MLSAAAGTVMTGPVLSSTVIVCVTLIELPQTSVTEYVLVIVSGQLSPSDTSETNNTTGATPQLSDSSVTASGSDAGTSPIHDTVTGPGLLAVGLILSSTVIVCVTLIELPQTSVTEYVLVIVSGQLSPSDTSETNNTTGATPQLSDSSVTANGSDAGTSPIHDTVTGPGLLAVGLILTSTVIVVAPLIGLPQTSVTEYVLVIVSGQLSPSDTSETNNTT